MINLYSAEYSGSTIPYLLEKAGEYLSYYNDNPDLAVVSSTINIYYLGDMYKLTIGIMVLSDDD